MKFTDFIKKIESDPEYREAQEALKVHFALGDSVLRARIKHGWSQAELAEMVGTKQANISRIEAGLGNPTLKLIQKITQVLELEISFSSAPSSTSYKAIFFDDAPISIDNWPVNPQGTQSQTYMRFGGEQR